MKAPKCMLMVFFLLAAAGTVVVDGQESPSKNARFDIGMNFGIGAGTFGAACGAEISLRIEEVALSCRISRSEVFLDIIAPSDWLVEKAFLLGIHTKWGSHFSSTLSMGVSEINGAKYRILGFLAGYEKETFEGHGIPVELQLFWRSTIAFLKAGFIGSYTFNNLNEQIWLVLLCVRVGWFP